MEEGKLRRIINELDFDLAQYRVLNHAEYVLIFDDWRKYHTKLNKILRQKFTFFRYF